MTSKYDAANPLALKRLLSRGVQLRGFSLGIMEACYKAANEVYAETAAVNPFTTASWISAVTATCGGR
jgi:TRAP-type mannitol/chloroaromatic compound transport system substrate-binding protein